MEKKVYFAGAIRGDRALSNVIIGLINFIKQDLGLPVLTEHVGTEDPIREFADKIGKKKENLTAEDIESQDIEWLNKSTHVIAEISGASTGTGREIEYARTKGGFGKIPSKVLCLYRRDREFFASPMIRGMTKDKYPNITIKSYETEEEARRIVGEFLKS